MNIIVDFRMDNEIRETLAAMGFELYNSYDQSQLYEGLRGHVDLSIFFDGQTFICSNESYDYYREILSEKIRGKYRLVQGIKKLETKYPGDVALNLAFTGKYAIGRLESLEPRLVDLLEARQDLQIIPVKQGYANCSICQVTDRAVITGDEGIYRILTNQGLDVLKIRPGYIDLEGMDYGFIGGASCDLGHGDIGFFGDLESHPDGCLIRDFIENHGKRVISLGSGRLKDYGSGLVF